MQQLQSATNLAPSSDGCARELLAGVPSVMRFIRCQMRGHREAGLTVPQFRALVFVSHTDDSSISAMAEHLGLSVPAASRMVDLLVRRGLMERQASLGDRRCVSLSLTPQGKATFRTALRATQVALARRFKTLSAQERYVVGGAMQILSRLFSPRDGEVERRK